MSNSVDSSRPMMNSTTPARASTRLSTYSSTPTLTPSIAPSTTSTLDARTADISKWNSGFDRLDDKRLQQQRYVVSNEKSGEMSKLALGAKLERALGRRLSGQDASFTRGVKGDKGVV